MNCSCGHDFNRTFGSSAKINRFVKCEDCGMSWRVVCSGKNLRGPIDDELLKEYESAFEKLEWIKVS